MRALWEGKDVDNPEDYKTAQDKFRSSGRSTGLWPELSCRHSYDIHGQYPSFSHRTEAGFPGPIVSVSGRASNKDARERQAVELIVRCFPGRFVDVRMVCKHPTTTRGGSWHVKVGVVWTTLTELWKRDLGEYSGRDKARWV